MANNNFSGYGYGGAQYGGSHIPYPAITSSTYANASAYQQAAAAGLATPVSYTDYRGALHSYDASKSYYPQATNNYSAGPTVSKTHYAAPPVKNVNAVPQRVPAANKSNGTTKPPLPPTAPPVTATQNFGYDNSLYNAAHMYAQHQGIGGTVTAVVPGISVKPNGGSWFPTRRGVSHAGGHSRGVGRPKPVPRPQQLHYCESCKISCAGPQTYREHLDGQKHKKREASLKMQASAQTTTQNRGNNYHCELCDVTCTGTDAYAAHVRGAKHQKVVKLHQKLGKPIPPDEPKKLGKINFVPAAGGAAEANSTKTEAATTEAESAENEAEAQEDTTNVENSEHIKPVGGEYIEEVKDDDGKIISFNCKLCECKFNDPNAKEMHTKGRRHRLQYKRKVQPDLVIDYKQTPRQRRMAEVRAQRALMHAPRSGENDSAAFWDEPRRHSQYDNELDYNFMMRSFVGPPQRGFMGRVGPAPPFGMMPAPNIRRPESTDDRHAIAKHAAIYPKEEELQNIQRIVSHTERALKLISEELLQPVNSGAQEKDSNQASLIRTVQRVGYLAKGLLLHGDKSVKFVALCTNKPTVGVLKRVADMLPTKLKDVVGSESSPIYEVSIKLEEAAVIVTDERGISVTTFFTSPLLRETNAGSVTKPTEINFDPLDDNSLLPRDCCIEALAEIRHSKWFAARATGLQSCVMVVRILRDMRQRIETWNAMPQWALELLAEKVISSAGYPLTPGDCLRRIMEALASGLFICGPGLLDPCEKEPTDALQPLTMQQREDITFSAQIFLRQIAFRQIYRVLDMEQLALVKFPLRPWRLNRKRRRSSLRGNPEDGDNATAVDDGNPEKVPKKECPA